MNENNEKLVLSFVLVMLTTGCVATYQPPLNAENRAKINNLEAVTLVAQEEIDVQFIPSMAGASAGASYGIIGALVGSAIDASINDTRSKEAEIRAKPYRDMLLGYDYRPVLNEAVANQVKGVQWTGDIIVTQDAQVEDFDVKTYQGQARDGIVFINSSYALSPAQDMVFVKAYIAVHERVDSPEGDKKAEEQAHGGVDFAVSVAAVPSNSTQTDHLISGTTEFLHTFESLTSATRNTRFIKVY